MGLAMAKSGINKNAVKILVEFVYESSVKRESHKSHNKKNDQ